LIELALIFLAGFGAVFLLGFQSRNVNSGNYAWAACTSFTIAIMQTTLWGQLFANLTWASSIVYGASGACGITLSMYVHKRWIAPKPKVDQ
jgi:hypothetical protein